MVQSRVLKFVKTGLILLNINFIILSFVLIIFGISEKGNIEKYESLIAESITSGLPPSPSNILITMGVITIITGAYGLRSVDNYCLMVSYAVFVSLLAMFHASIGISASFMEENAHKSLETGLVQSLKMYNRSEGVEGNWDRMQRELKCCGVYNYEDWSKGIGGEVKEDSEGFKQFKGHALVGIPGSCFHQGEDSITEEDLNQQDFVQENVYTEGCLSKAVADIGIDGLQRIGFILAIGNFLAAIAASVMAHNIRNNLKAY